MTRFVALLRNLAPLAGRCPACRGVMDETGCRIGDDFRVRLAARRRTGIGRVVEVFCKGAPTAPVIECPVCQA